jgi:anti-sigma-K factor RskA
VNHDEAAELLGAYALDAVGEEEAALVAAHVEECPRCTAELAEHREVAGMLGNMGGDAPRELWDRIASQATRPSSAPLQTPALAPSSLGGSDRRHRRRGARRGPWLVAGALVAVAAVTIALMAVQISSLNTKVGRLAAIAGQQGISRSEQAALLDPSTRRVVLRGPIGTPIAQAEVVLVRSGLSYFVNDKMAALPASSTYQLWAISGGQAVSLGLLGRGPNVVPFVVSTVRPPMRFAVTVERATGAVTPTSNPVAISAVTA